MYICIESFETSDGTLYEEKDQISDEAFAYLQPIDRENFEKI